MSYELNEPAITATEVADENRLAFLPQLFGRGAYLLAEQQVFRLAGKYSKAYQGGYWRFYTLSCGGGFLCPDSDDTFPVSVSSNDYSGEMSAEAFGIFISCMVLNLQAWAAHDKGKTDLSYHLIVQWERLRAFADQHPEAGKIYRALN